MDDNFDVKKHLPIIGIVALIVILILASRKSGSGGASIASYNQALQVGAQADNDLARIEAGRSVELARVKDSAFGKLLQFKLASQTVEAGERTAFMEATTGREIALSANQLTAAIEGAKLQVARELGFKALTTQEAIETSRNSSTTRLEEVRAELERERARLTSGAAVATAQAQAAAQTAAAQAAAGAQTAVARSASSSQTTGALIGAIASVGNRILDRVFRF